MAQRSIRDVVIDVLRSVSKDAGSIVGEIQGSMDLDVFDFDSLDWAVVVAMLEDKLGFDPFLDGQVATMPRTVDELIACYERRGQ